MELALSIAAALGVITLATSVFAIAIATRKAPPESTEALAVRVSSLHIEVEELRDALDRWGKRQSVRDSRARAAMAPEQDPLLAQPKTGILRQPMLPGARLLGAKQPNGGA